MLMPQIISDLAALLAKHQITLGVVTGCFWGKGQQQAEQTIQRLTTPPSYFCFSIDAWHLKEIGEQSYINCLQVCSDSQIPVRLFLTYDYSLSSQEDLHILEFVFDLLNRFDIIVSTWQQPLRAVGRASDIIGKRKDEVIESSLLEIEDGGCMLIRAPNIDNDGHYYPCCGDWHDDTSWDLESRNILSLGTIQKSSIVDLMHRHETSLLVKLLNEAGPKNLNHSLGLEPNASTNICDHCRQLCQHLSRNSEIDLALLEKTLNHESHFTATSRSNR